MITSGETEKVTTSDAAVIALNAGPQIVRKIQIINEGDAPGFFQFDGINWGRLPAKSSVSLEPTASLTYGVKVKRVAGGANLSGIYAYAY